MLSEDSDLLPKNDENLFGKKFLENIKHTSKSETQTLEILSNTSRTKYNSFLYDLPQTLRRSFGGQQQQKLLLTKGTTFQYSKNDMVNINQEALFSKVEFPYVVQWRI